MCGENLHYGRYRTCTAGGGRQLQALSERRYPIHRRRDSREVLSCDVRGPEGLVWKQVQRVGALRRVHLDVRPFPKHPLALPRRCQQVACPPCCSQPQSSAGAPQRHPRNDSSSRAVQSPPHISPSCTRSRLPSRGMRTRPATYAPRATGRHARHRQRAGAGPETARAGEAVDRPPGVCGGGDGDATAAARPRAAAKRAA